MSGQGAVPAAASAERQLIDLMTGFWRTQSLYVATELGILDHLDESRPMSGAEVALGLNLNTDAVTRLLGYLASLEVISGDDTAGYVLGEMGALLRTGAPSAMRDHMLLYGNQFYRAWGELASSVRHGGSTFARVFGADLFSYLREHPDTSHSYERMMAAGLPFFTEVRRVFDFSAAELIVDVAGGHGALLDQILAGNPGPRAMLFDVPHVVREARHYPIALDHAERCDLVGGDFFAGVPDGGDVYLLSRILHCFDDEACHRILVNCRSAMAADGSLVILERIIGAGATRLAHGFDMHMLVVLGGGRERDETQYKAMLDKAGFELERVHLLPLDTHLLVATPRADHH